MSRDEIAALFTRRDQSWRLRDAAGLAADHADDCVADSPMQGRLVGRATIGAVYDSWFKAFPDLLLTTRELIIDGHRVVQIYHVSGTQAAAFGGVPATGRRVEFKGVWLYTLSIGGKIIADERLYDVTNVLVQLGALRAKPMD